MPVSVYVQSVAFLVLAVAALFGSAGTIAIATYWVYLGIFAGVFVASILLIDPDLARERMRPGGKRAPLAVLVFSGVLAAHWVLAGLDHGRFHWSDTVPTWLQWAALVAMAAANRLALWAMRINRFFSSVIRIQSDRGQVVVTTGPYAVIRHPGYLAGVIVMVTSGIALNSWLATAMLVVLTVPFLLYRTIVEDRVLKAELPGYKDYANRVRWRLLPGVW
jgi:protein-S-isoprenylcysteine O-methyltransferase Ste14